MKKVSFFHVFFWEPPPEGAIQVGLAISSNNLIKKNLSQEYPAAPANSRCSQVDNQNQPSHLLNHHLNTAVFLVLEYSQYFWKCWIVNQSKYRYFYCLLYFVCAVSSFFRSSEGLFLMLFLFLLWVSSSFPGTWKPFLREICMWALPQIFVGHREGLSIFHFWLLQLWFLLRITFLSVCM